MPRKFTFRGTDPDSGESYTFEREFPREMTFEEAQRWAESNVDWDGYYGPPSVVPQPRMLVNLTPHDLTHPHPRGFK